MPSVLEKYAPAVFCISGSESSWGHSLHEQTRNAASTCSRPFSAFTSYCKLT